MGEDADPIYGPASARCLCRSGRPSAPTLRLQQLSDPLSAIADSSAPPRDLTDNEAFREAIADLRVCTGRTELVFDGHFDLIAEVWPAAAEEKRG